MRSMGKGISPFSSVTCSVQSLKVGLGAQAESTIRTLPGEGKVPPRQAYHFLVFCPYDMVVNMWS